MSAVAWIVGSAGAIGIGLVAAKLKKKTHAAPQEPPHPPEHLYPVPVAGGDGSTEVIWSQIKPSSGKYPIASGETYRVLAGISPAPLVSIGADSIKSYLEAHGWQNVHVYGQADTLPADWPDKRRGDGLWYVEAAALDPSNAGITKTAAGTTQDASVRTVVVDADAISVFRRDVSSSLKPSYLATLADDGRPLNMHPGEVLRVTLPGRVGWGGTVGGWVFYELGDVLELVSQRGDAASGNVIADLRAKSDYGALWAVLLDVNGKTIRNWHLSPVDTRATSKGGGTLGAGTLGDTGADVAIIETALIGKVSTDQLREAVTSYTGLSNAQESAVLGAASSLAQGHAPSLASLSPIVAGGIAAIPGVGLPAAAVVAAALPIVGALFSALGIGGGAGNCTPDQGEQAWTVGKSCFKGHLPYGPGDPKWRPWTSFIAGTDWQFALFGQGPSPGQDLETYVRDISLDQSFPWYRRTIACEMTSKATDPASLFRRTYYTAWQANAERAINGNPHADDYDLLRTAADAWNRAHAGPSVTLTPQRLADGGSKFCLANGVTFVGLLLNGDIDGRDRPPLSINVGPEYVKIPHITPGPSGGGGGGAKSPSKAGKVAGGVAVAGGGAALVWLAASKTGRTLVSHGLRKLTKKKGRR